MKKSKTGPKQHIKLRKRTEEFLNKTPQAIKKMSPMDVRNLVEDLQIHQIELEMHNDELRKALEELEKSRMKYFHLYDHVPIGYFTFDQNGLILEVNHTGTELLGVQRRYLMKSGFSRFIASDFQDVFHCHRKRVFETKTKQTCELKLVKKDGTLFHAQLESIPVQGDDGNFQIGTAITDITEGKRT
jgi:PAS domain S-box-containing protein